MSVQELATLISVRDYAVRIYNGIDVKLSSEETKMLGAKINGMNKLIVDGILKLELSALSKNK